MPIDFEATNARHVRVGILRTYPVWSCAKIVVALLLLLAPEWGAAQGEGRSELSFTYVQDAALLTIDDVCCERAAFPDATVSSVSAGLGGAAVWIRLPDLPAGTILVVSKIVDEATLYERVDRGDEVWRISRAGDTVAPSGQALEVAQMAFALSVDTVSGAPRYLRVIQPNSIRFGLSAWEPETYHADIENRRIVQMLLLGFISAIVAYNIVVSVPTRDIVFAMNAATILSLLTIDLYLSGLGALSLWPREFSNVALVTGLVGTSLFGALFISRFLFASVGNPSARPLLVSGAMAPAIGGTVLFLPYWYPQTALIWLVVTMLIIAIATALLQLFRGNRNAYLLGLPLLGVMLPGGSLVVLDSFTDIALGAIEPHLLEVTLACEALAFSLALAARIRSQRLAVVSAREQLAEAEIESARRYAELQEKERARIASDLHDSIGHNLVMISGLLENGLTGVEKDSGSASAAKLTRRTLQQVRQLSHALHPSTLSDLGWTAATDSLFENLDRSSGMAVDVLREGEEPNLGPDAKVHLYRVLQELVSNIAKHSSATSCQVRFVNDGRVLFIEILDDGIGIASRDKLKKGLGIASIEERLKAIRGKWQMSPGEPKGLCTRLEIPLARGIGDE